MTAADPKLSGINLSRPSDSGINLQTGAGLGLGQADSIELAPLSDEELPTSKAPKPTPRPSRRSPSRRWRPRLRPPSRRARRTSSTTPTSKSTSPASTPIPTTRPSSSKPPATSTWKTATRGSEVFAIDEEAVDQNASTAMAPSAFAEDEDEEEDDGFDSAVSSEMTAGWSSSESSASPERSAPAMVLSRESDPEWSGLWVGMLGVTTLFLFFASFVAYDLVRNLYEFQSGGTMGSGLVRAIAGMFGGLIAVSKPTWRRTLVAIVHDGPTVRLLDRALRHSR